MHIFVSLFSNSMLKIRLFDKFYSVLNVWIMKMKYSCSDADTFFLCYITNCVIFDFWRITVCSSELLEVSITDDGYLNFLVFVITAIAMQKRRCHPHRSTPCPATLASILDSVEQCFPAWSYCWSVSHLGWPLRPYGWLWALPQSPPHGDHMQVAPPTWRHHRRSGWWARSPGSAPAPHLDQSSRSSLCRGWRATPRPTCSQWWRKGCRGHLWQIGKRLSIWLVDRTSRAETHHRRERSSQPPYRTSHKVTGIFPSPQCPTIRGSPVSRHLPVSLAFSRNRPRWSVIATCWFFYCCSCLAGRFCPHRAPRSGLLSGKRQLLNYLYSPFDLICRMWLMNYKNSDY